MTEKFTPGEWKIEERQAHCKGFELYGFAILTETKRICMCQTDDPENIPQMKANAALIAAAPEMYRVLDAIYDVMMDSSDCGTIPVDKIEAVLKKARGEE